MRLMYMRLKNFIGIQLGLGVNEIEIPFYNGKNKICMMIGANGSGKSTILDNAVPQPYVTGNDRAKIIIVGMDGEKEMWYQRGRLMYKLLIKYNWNKSTESHSTKGYILRIDGDKEEQLNPNGNITSFKEIIDMEFMLDPSFMRLCKLSQEAVNISRMKTTERKTLMSSLLDEASAYIEYGKKVDGKCRFLNTTIKNLASKIDKVGNIDDIKINLNRVSKQILETQSDLEIYKNKTAVTGNKLSELDLSGYNQLLEYIDADNRVLNGNAYEKNKIINNSSASFKLRGYREKGGIDKLGSRELEKIMVMANAEKETKVKEEQEIKNNLNLIRAKFETTNTELQVNIKHRDSVHRLELPEDIKKSISIYEEQLRDIDAKLANVDVVYESEKLLQIQDLVQEINQRIDRNLNIAPELFEALMINFEKGSCISLKKQFDSKYEMNVGMEYNLMKKRIPAVQEKLYSLKAQRELKTKLESRPSSCKIDNCPFIVDALGVPSNLEEQIQQTETELETLLAKQETARKNQDIYMDASKICLEFQEIYGMIKDNRELLDEAPDNWHFTVSAFVERIRNHSLFNDPVIDLNSHLIIASLNERYRDIVDNILPRLNRDLELSQHTEFILQSYIDKIESCQNLLKEYSQEIESNSGKLNVYKFEIMDLSVFLEELERLVYLQTHIEKANENLIKYHKEEDKYKELIELRDRLTKEYEENNKMVVLYQSKLDSLTTEKDQYSYDEKLYQEYTDERERLEKSFIIHEKIRYALSSKTGIPLIFLDMYLNKTRLYANAILEELFGDEYKLCSFEINATEFRIPCEVRGELVSDIALMSSGERAILSLVLSLTLMYQSSSEGSYDIITLDEMDAVLDKTNRNRFVDALEKLMEIFNIEQILAVSHNDGFESYPVDLVLLRDYKLENTTNKTIIYKFK